nr:MAG TPA: hypothetical protein [Caudoviricetes sp.]
MPCGNVSGYSIPQKGGDVNAESDFSTCLRMHKADWVDGGHRGIYCSDDSDCNDVNNRKEVCNMNTNLQVVETNNQRVLTTAQIAEQYGTDTKAISKNFTRNKERYTEGKHYYCLTGDAKREFLNRYQIDDGLRATVFYLWTEKGALLHAKSLNTDKAWQAYEVLVDTYFSVRELGQLPQRPDRTKALEVKEMNARVRMSNQFLKLANAETTLSKDYKSILIAKAAEVLAGEAILPMPKSEQKMYTATEIGKMLGVSAQKIGRLSSQNGMKTEEYGEFYKDKSPYSCKEVDAFRYNEKAVERFKELL